MKVRIRFHHGPKIEKGRRKNQHIALAFASLLAPAALCACALALWRIASDLGVAGEFAITQGLFSHWQVWLGCSALLQFVSIGLNRYGNTRRVLPETEPTGNETLLNSGF